MFIHAKINHNEIEYMLIKAQYSAIFTMACYAVLFCILVGRRKEV